MNDLPDEASRIAAASLLFKLGITVAPVEITRVTCMWGWTGSVITHKRGDEK